MPVTLAKPTRRHQDPPVPLRPEAEPSSSPPKGPRDPGRIATAAAPRRPDRRKPRRSRWGVRVELRDVDTVRGAGRSNQPERRDPDESRRMTATVGFVREE